MKILFLLKEKPEATLRTIMEEIRRHHDVSVMDLRESPEPEYEHLVEQIISCDRVISW